MPTDYDRNTSREVNREINNRRARRRKRRQRQMMKNCLVMVVLAVVLIVGTPVIAERMSAFSVSPENSYGTGGNNDFIPDSSEDLTASEKLHTIETNSAYPENLVEFAKKYDQVIDYVYNYPLLKDEKPEIDLSKEAASDSMPLLLQWDDRWGYLPYAGGLMGYTGCGPTSLSMVTLYLTKDPQWTPKEVAAYAVKNGYSVTGKGSRWTLISDGCKAFGLKAKELPLHESTMKAELDKDHPIILIVGPGDFTYSGHFLVITGYNEAGFTVNDPNSRENSDKTWSYDQIKGQIKNLWAMSKA